MTLRINEEVEGMYQGALWRVLRDAYLRAILGPGKAASGMSPEQTNTMLDGFHRDMDMDVRRLMVVVHKAREDILEGIVAGLHSAPGVDHEMIDQSVRFALSYNSENPEPRKTDDTEEKATE